MSAFEHIYRASHALDAVERWLTDCVLLRETGAIGPGRKDGIIVPVSWNAPVKSGFYGVEVKVSRSDFLRGLREGQYEKYAATLNGLYVVTPHGEAKTSEVPVGIGHLVVTKRWRYGYVCVCKRHPRRREIAWTPADFWAVWWDLFDQMRREAGKTREQYERWQKEAGEKVLGPFMQSMKRLEKSLILEPQPDQTETGCGG